ncbi:MAG: class I SAM-dependent methyltransferase [Elusimicrobiales bacterium]
MTSSTPRFPFGENWADFLKTVDEERIVSAQASLARMLRADTLSGKTFLDIGCGSGIFSLAARRLGAKTVSFDFDGRAVQCAETLKRKYFPSDDGWRIERGSVLDGRYLASLGRFDIVYSWGVLHHTGNMFEAVSNAAGLVAGGGMLCIAIYNDQGGSSRRWLKIKRLYNALPVSLRPVYVAFVAAAFESKYGLARLLQGRNPLPFAGWRSRKRERGMSVWHDWTDWVGGYPFEFAKPCDIFRFVRDMGFTLVDMSTTTGYGCNEYVFVKAACPVPDKL